MTCVENFAAHIVPETPKDHQGAPLGAALGHGARRSVLETRALLKRFRASEYTAEPTNKRERETRVRLATVDGLRRLHCCIGTNDRVSGGSDLPSTATMSKNERDRQCTRLDRVAR